MLMAFSLSLQMGCAKQKEKSDNDCKVCKAYPVDGGQDVITEKVCSESEESAFRNKHSGREISCQ